MSLEENQHDNVYIKISQFVETNVIKISSKLAFFITKSYVSCQNIAYVLTWKFDSNFGDWLKNLVNSDHLQTESIKGRSLFPRQINRW